MSTESIQKFLYFAAFLPGGYIHSKAAELLWIMVLGSMRAVWPTCYTVFSLTITYLTWSWVSGPAESTVVVKTPAWTPDYILLNRKVVLLGGWGILTCIFHTTLGRSHPCRASQIPPSASPGWLGTLLWCLDFPRLHPGSPGNVLSLPGPRVSINAYVIHPQLWIHSKVSTWGLNQSEDYSWSPDSSYFGWAFVS